MRASPADSAEGSRGACTAAVFGVCRNFGISLRKNPSAAAERRRTDTAAKTRNRRRNRWPKTRKSGERATAGAAASGNRAAVSRRVVLGRWIFGFSGFRSGFSARVDASRTGVRVEKTFACFSEGVSVQLPSERNLLLCLTNLSLPVVAIVGWMHGCWPMSSNLPRNASANASLLATTIPAGANSTK